MSFTENVKIFLKLRIERQNGTYRLEILLCTLTQEVQCQTFHRNHVIWRTKKTNFDGMEMIRNNSIVFKQWISSFFLVCQAAFSISIETWVIYQVAHHNNNY